MSDWQNVFNTGYLQMISTLITVFIVYNLVWYIMDKAKAIQSPSQFASEKCRPLDKLESSFHLLALERQGATNICLILSLRSEAKLVKEYVHNALVLLAKRQPMLRAIIKTSTSASWITSGTKEKYFEIIDGDQISDMIDFTSSDAKGSDWQDVWLEVASKLRGTHGLLWKAVVLQEEFLSEEKCFTNTLLFTFNHCCIDGVSSMKFCQQFLCYLNGLAEGSITSDKVVSSLNLSPSLVDLVVRKRPWSIWQFLATCPGIPRISKFIFKMILRRTLSRKQHNPFFVQFPANIQPSCTPRSSVVSNAVFSETETSNIVKACRLNGCTVTGAMMAVVHLALCNLMLPDGNATDMSDVGPLEHGYAVNAQRYCQPKPPEDYLGNFVAAKFVWTKFTSKKEANFWALAADITKQIRCHVEKELAFNANMTVLNILSTEEIVDQFFCPPDRQDFIRLSHCNVVSNMGSFDLEEGQGTYKLHECFITCIQHTFGDAFSHYATTFNGKMSWVILCDHTMVTDREQANMFANLCFNHFVEIAKQVPGHE